MHLYNLLPPPTNVSISIENLIVTECKTMCKTISVITDIRLYLYLFIRGVTSYNHLKMDILIHLIKRYKYIHRKWMIIFNKK